MKTLKFIFPFIILFSIFGCKKKEEDKLQFEKNVLSSVFVEIVDSIYMDRRIIFPPPPPRFNEKTNTVDTTGHAAELKEYWNYRDSIKNDKRKILLGVYDQVAKISSLETEMIFKEIKVSGYTYDISKETEEYKLDLKPFATNKKFHFESMSKFPQEKNWDLNDISNLKLPVGSIFISRIQFDKNRTSGILSAGASCGGGKCGRGFFIKIKNKSGKWKISQIFRTWVS